jgi:hypothetical protein
MFCEERGVKNHIWALKLLIGLKFDIDTDGDVEKKIIIPAETKIEIGIITFIKEGRQGSDRGERSSQFRAAPLIIAPIVRAVIGVFKFFFVS